MAEIMGLTTAAVVYAVMFKLLFGTWEALNEALEYSITPN
ncbi:hypothetical protein APED_22000 [Acanthopleuribacter pedis]